jgi:hypothetical protein
VFPASLDCFFKQLFLVYANTTRVRQKQQHFKINSTFYSFFQKIYLKCIRYTLRILSICTIYLEQHFKINRKFVDIFFFQNLHVTPFIYKYSTITNYSYRIIKLIHDMFVLNYRNYHCHPDNMFHVTRFYRQQSPIREFQF